MVVVEDITMEPHIMERHIMGAMEVVKFVKKKTLFEIISIP